MPQKDGTLSEIEQFKVKGRELVALAISIVANDDFKEPLPRSSVFAIRRRAIVLLEGAIAFVEAFLRLQDCANGGVKIVD